MSKAAEILEMLEKNAEKEENMAMRMAMAKKKKKKKNESEEEDKGKEDKEKKKEDEEDKDEAAMGAGGEFSPYRNKFGELSDKKSAVLFLDSDGEWFRMKGGAKGKKIGMDKFGRSAREAGKNVRAYDGEKLS